MPLLVSEPITPTTPVPSWYLPTDPVARAITIRQGASQILFDRAYHPDVQDYWRRVVAAGGSVAIPKLIALNKAVQAIYASGLRGAVNFLKYWLCLNLTESFTGCLVPVYDDGVGNATNVNFVSGDWSSTLGLTGNGVDKYLNSNYILSTSLGTFTIGDRSDFHQGCWVTNYISPAPAGTELGLMGIRYSSGVKYSLCCLGTDLYSQQFGRDGTYNVEIASGTGFVLGNTVSLGNHRIRLNENIATATASVAVIQNPDLSNYLFTRNSLGSPTGYTSSSASNFTMGFGLTTTQETALYNSLRLVT